MKRYMLFAYYRYYPAGGMNDFIDSYDTIEEALAHVNETVKYEDCEEWPKHDYEHAHVFDTTVKHITYFKEVKGQWVIE
jgi:hypothetical protein